MLTTSGYLDRYTVRPVVVPLVVALFTGVAISFAPLPGSLCFAILAVVWATWTLADIYRLVAAVWRRLWRRACSLTAIIVCSGPARAVLMVIPGDQIRLAIVYPFYRAEITRDQSRPHFFDRGGRGGSQRSLAYDDLGTLKADVGTTVSREGVWRDVRYPVGDF